MIPQINHPIKSKDKVLYPKQVDSLTSVQRIVCGSDHCFALKANSEIYAWGNNNKCQLGIPLEGSLNNLDIPISILYQPTLVEALLGKGIDRIATGSDHTFAWRNGKGEVYGWGSGNFGKLGHGNRSNYTTPKLVECFKEASAVGMKVCEIVCGDNHTLAVLENADDGHELFVWGSSKSWQLGLEGDISDDVLEPHSIDPDPFDGKVLTIGGCHNYSSCVTKDGKIYTWGSGEFGRLGYATETRQQKIPKLINALEKIVKVSLGFYHSAAISQQGIVYSWGRGINGQLGHGDSPNEDYPKPIKSLAQKKITDVSCGENHTVAITDLGEIYSWGAGQFGQLGHGDILRQCSPMKIAVFEEKIIIQVSAGRKHSMALTANGHVYTWGSNEYGQLGLKNLGNVHAKKPSQVFPDKLYPAYSARNYIHGSPNIVDPFTTEKNSEEKNDIISDTADNLTFSPINQFPLLKLPPDINRRILSSEKKNSENQDLLTENKNLTKRVKELELRFDPNEIKSRQKTCYDLTQQYVKIVEDEFTCKPGDMSKNVILNNTKIDELMKEFRIKIAETDQNDSVTITFCLSMFEKICELKKKANYSMI